MDVRASHSASEEDAWSPSHETLTEERHTGEIRLIAEDGRGTLDGNDLIVRFRWVV